MHKSELKEQFRAMKCKHTRTLPTAFVNPNGGESICHQCTQCGKGIQEVRKSKSLFNFSDLPPFDHDYREQQQQARIALRTKMWDEADD